MVMFVRAIALYFLFIQMYITSTSFGIMLHGALKHSKERDNIFKITMIKKP